MSRPTPLHLFSSYYGFDYGLLSGDDRYEIANPEAGFDGQVFAIRLTENGRFGNVFYQILHAILLARSIGCAVIELFPFEGGPPQGQETIQDLTFVCASSHQTSRPTLVGHFFNSYPFQSALTGFDPDLVLETIDIVLRPLFRHLLNRAASPLTERWR